LLFSAAAAAVVAADINCQQSLCGHITINTTLLTLCSSILAALQQ
jgi:hypothetical protein